MKIKLFKLLIFNCAAILLLFPQSALSIEYTVRTIYFVPNDVVDKLDQINLEQIMRNIQSTYKNELDRHGFIDTSFKLETGRNGDVVIHKVNGRHNKNHYATEQKLLSVMEQELNDKFVGENNNIYAVVMAGLDSLQNGFAAGLGKARPDGQSGKGNYGGYALTADGHNKEQVLMHELGHTFGLHHIILYNPAEFILGSGRKLALHEARWLANSHYFTEKRNFNLAPRLTKVHLVTAVERGVVEFKMDFTDNNGVHQVYIFDREIVGWSFVPGKVNSTVIFKVNRGLLSLPILNFQAMDTLGNWHWWGIGYNLPPDIPKGEEDIPQVNREPIDKNPDLETKDEEEDDDKIVVIEKPRNISPKGKITLKWAVLKAKRR